MSRQSIAAKLWGFWRRRPKLVWMEPTGQAVPNTVPAKGPNRLLIGVVVLIVAGLTAVFFWASTDPEVRLETDLAESFDLAFGGRSADTWCLNGCSGSAHEWHSLDDLDAVAELVAAEAREIGAEAAVQPGANGANAVSIGRGSALILVGVTSPEWTSATNDAIGVAVWFSSVTLLDG